MRTLHTFTVAAIAVATILGSASACADAVTDWNRTADELITAAKMGTPPAIRVMALVQTAVHEAVSALPPQADATAQQAAVAAANRVALGKLLPQQEAAITAAYQAALARLGDGQSTAAGVAARVLAWRADDGAATPERYRPHAAPGVYVPTAAAAASQWPQRKPWLMNDAAQFRPAPPPALNSAQWARDYNEVKALGARASTHRSAEQTAVARFWEYSLPAIYHGVVRSVAQQPGRSLAQNARLFAATGQAMDDAVIAVMDAKYHHHFWRPVTAIRNGDRDEHPATDLQAGWTPLIDTPMHPEYPSAHSVLASSVGEVIKAEVGRSRLPELSTSSPTANGATRRWKSVDAFVQEVADARVWAGIHFRSATEVGTDMGRQVGALAVARVAQPPLAAAVPPALTPQGAARFAERIAARGVQVYECRADAAAPGGAQWIFVGPQAELFDAAGKPVGSHDSGPHWQAADGSRIVGAVQARADAPQADAIPWLLLSARSVGNEGRFARVTQIQRVNTQGGTAPARACSAAAVGETERVPYTADYLFYVS
ncbi:DUF3455 domain-containing protein [Hydrogenophaga intermedia]|uniref:DUF3455 domain-containing protein n=1 Tax=Hydrogenophaga intermedia TaxID=65786 RepID=UPI002043E876|nr:DUF3455 domain-containing protein [Hydrogenophaga intermedia]MCM3564284.1 DUF3455 domain-containing protein [Hydrogenophaga intermedia]